MVNQVNQVINNNNNSVNYNLITGGDVVRPVTPRHPRLTAKCLIPSSPTQQERPFFTPPSQWESPTNSAPSQEHRALDQVLYSPTQVDSQQVQVAASSAQVDSTPTTSPSTRSDATPCLVTSNEPRTSNRTKEPPRRRNELKRDLDSVLNNQNLSSDYNDDWNSGRDLPRRVRRRLHDTSNN